MKKRIVSIALALCLCLSSQSVAYAGLEEPVPEGMFLRMNLKLGLQRLMWKFLLQRRFTSP